MRRFVWSALPLAIVAGVALTCQDDISAIARPLAALVVNAGDTAKVYAKRDSLVAGAVDMDLDSIARDKRAPLYSQRAQGRIRAWMDSLRKAPFVAPDTTTPPPPDTTTPPPPDTTTPPPTTAFCGVTGTGTVATSAFAKPAYLSPMHEPDFHTIYTRITGDPGTPIGNGVSGNWPAIAAQHYSKDNPWSADGRLLFLSRFSPALSFQYLFMDGITYQPLFGRNVPGPEARWHPTKPDTMIYVTANGSAGYWNVRTNTFAVRAAASGYSSASMGNNEGNPSYDGRYVAILATRADGKKVTYALDLVAGTKGPDVDLAASGASSTDWASVSAGGRYIVAAVNDRQTYVFDRATAALVYKETAMLFGHADLGLDGTGAEVLWGGVGGVLGNASSPFNKTFTSLALAGGAKWATTPATTYNGHASTRADKRPGWGYGVVNTTDGGLGGELFAAKLSAPMTVERWGRHRSNVTSGTSGFIYSSEPHAVPNHDGSKYMFASNWGSTTVVSAFVASCQ